MALSIEEALGPTGYYEKHGEDAVLLIHGLTGTPAEMRPIAKRLAKQGFSIMCPALAGHCRAESDLRKSKWRDWYNSMADAFDALKAQHRRVYVTGLSIGALLAIKLAAEKGEQVAGVGLMSCTFFYDGWNMPRWRRKLLLPVVLHSPLRYFLYWRETEPYGIKCERTRAMVHAVLENRDAQATEKVGIFRTSGVTIMESNRFIKVAKAALPHVKSPALIVHSTEDDTASLKNAHYVAKRLGARQIETFFVDDTYHVVTLDKRRDDIARRLADFFKRHTGMVPA